MARNTPHPPGSAIRAGRGVPRQRGWKAESVAGVGSRTLKDWLTALHAHGCRPKREGDGYRASCPGPMHDNGNRKSPALKITEGNNGVLAHCFAGCTFDDVRKALGLEPEELPPEPATAPARKRDKPAPAAAQPTGTVYSYPYYDREAKLHLVVKMRRGADMKKIGNPWREPAGIKGPFLLYRWQSVAANPTKPIMVCEGEHTADCANDIFGDRYETVSSCGGAAQAGQSNWSIARTRDVLIWPDADEAGDKYAADVRELCLAAGTDNVKLVPVEGLPDGWDLADAIPDGEDIEARLARAVDVTTSLSGSPLEKELGTETETGGRGLPKWMTPPQMFAYASTEREWLLEGVLPMGDVSVFVGKPKAGKSSMARGLALSVCRGQPFIGRVVKQGPVGYWSLQEAFDGCIDHFRLMGMTDDDALRLGTIRGLQGNDNMAELIEFVKAENPVVVFLDTLMPFFGVTDGNAYAEVDKAFAPLLDYAHKTKTHFALVHHLKKGETSDMGDGVLGSTAIMGSVATALFLSCASNNVRTMKTRQRYGKDISDAMVIDMDQETGWITTSGTAHQAHIAILESQVLEFLKGRGRPAGINEINDGVTGKAVAIRRVLNQMTSAGILNSWREAGKRGKPFMHDINRSNA